MTIKKRMPRVAVGVTRYLKRPHCSMAMSAEHRSKFAALHRQWWRLHMSVKFSSGTNQKQNTNSRTTITNAATNIQYNITFGGDTIVDAIKHK